MDSGRLVTYPIGMVHISFNFSGVSENATLENNNAGVKSDTRR